MNQVSEEKTLVTNKRAEHDYFILQRIEAGIALKGTEVKSLRQGKANFLDAYVDFINGEAFLVNMHISEYTQGNRFNHEEKERENFFSIKEKF